MSEHKDKYVLRYEGSYTVEMTFPADLQLEDMAERLRYFLAASSWTPNQVNEIIGCDDE